MTARRLADPAHAAGSVLSFARHAPSQHSRLEPTTDHFGRATEGFRLPAAMCLRRPARGPAHVHRSTGGSHARGTDVPLLGHARALAVDDGVGEPRRTLLSMIGTRSTSIPAGNHATLIGGNVVELRLDEPLIDTSISDAFPETIALAVGDLGALYVFRPIGFVDPDTPQDGSSALPLEALIGFDRIDVTSWFERMYRDVTSTDTVLVGEPATRLSGIPRTADSWRCGDLTHNDARCITTWASAAGWWYATDDQPPGATYHVRDHDLFVVANPHPTADRAVSDAAVAEILSHLTVQAPSTGAAPTPPTAIVPHRPLRWI